MRSRPSVFGMMDSQAPAGSPDESNIEHTCSKSIRSPGGTADNSPPVPLARIGDELGETHPVGTPQPMTAPTPTERDPVCWMSVNPATAKHVHEHAGKEYYFCCAGCVEKFKLDPQKYLNKPAAGLVTLGMPGALKTASPGSSPTQLQPVAKPTPPK